MARLLTFLDLVLSWKADGQLTVFSNKILTEICSSKVDSKFFQHCCFLTHPYDFPVGTPSGVYGVLVEGVEYLVVLLVLLHSEEVPPTVAPDSHFQSVPRPKIHHSVSIERRLERKTGYEWRQKDETETSYIGAMLSRYPRLRNEIFND